MAKSYKEKFDEMMELSKEELIELYLSDTPGSNRCEYPVFCRERCGKIKGSKI